jgi:glutamate-1-semialdehyde 2,1-aminomutase
MTVENMKNPYRYVDAKAVTAQLDALIQKPIHSIDKAALAQYEKDFYGEKCRGSHAMVDQAMQVIPGGVQHNLAFNYPFPLVFTKAEGNKLYDIDGNVYFDFLQAGGPTVLGSNPPEIREKVEALLNTCGPSTGLFHEYEYKIADKIVELVPSVDMLSALRGWPQNIKISSKWAALIMDGAINWPMGYAYRGRKGSSQQGYRVSFLNTHRSFFQTT